MLVRHVLASMSLHLAMVLPIPISVCKAIEKCMWKLSWSTLGEKRKASYVNWKKACLPKSEGGLEICQIHEVNLASFISLGWKAVSFPPCGLPSLETDTLRKASSGRPLDTQRALVFVKNEVCQSPPSFKV